MDDYIDENMDWFNNSVIGCVLGCVIRYKLGESNVTNSSTLSHTTEDLVRRVAYVCFVFSLSEIKIENGVKCLCIDVTQESIQTGFRRLLNYIFWDTSPVGRKNKRSTGTENDTVNVKRDIIREMKTYNPNMQDCCELNVLLYDDVRTWAGIENEIQDNDPNTSSFDSSLIKLVRRQYNILKRKKRLCPQKSPESLYIDVTEIDRKPISDYIYGCLINQKSVIVYGSGEMGKTTLSNHIYERMCREYIRDVANPAPIILNPRLLQDWEETSVEDLISLVIASHDKMSDIAIDDYTQVVFFIDGLDEYYAPESPELRGVIPVVEACPTLVTGRTEICNMINHAFRVTVDLKASIPSDVFKAIFRKYNPDSFKTAERIVDQLHGLEYTPMIAAVMATFWDRLNIESNNELMRVLLYDRILSDMINDKLASINRTSGQELRESDVKYILQEYAWVRYSHVTQNYQDRLVIIQKRTRYGERAVRACVDAFTYLDRPNDRMFLHMSLQDYLVSQWLIDRFGKDDTDMEVFQVMFKTPVNRFVGESMLLNPRIARQAVNWCKRMYEVASREEDALVRDNHQTKILYLLARPAIIGDTNVINDINTKYNEILNDENYAETPQLCIVYIAIVQFGKMDREDEYATLLRSSERFAEIIRILYMIYMGDLDSNTNNFVDIEGGVIENTVRRYIGDLSDEVLKNKRHCELCRVQTILMHSFFEHGYVCSNDLIRKLAELDVHHICEKIKCRESEIQADIAMAGRSASCSFDLSFDKFIGDLENELNLLKRVAFDLVSGGSAAYND